MNATTKVKLRDISPTLSCNLCRGYMIDATTTIECLHSFCKSCIVRHLENSEYCPVCEVQLHSTKPLSGIRSDQMLQEIIYKLVPGLYTREMERRRQFYKDHPKSVPTSRLDSGEISQQPYITSDDKINISMEYFTDDKNIQEISRKYLQIPAEVSVFVLRQWVQGKHELPNDTKIEILHGDNILPQDFLLMDIAFKYSWTEAMTKPLQLKYRITSPLLPSILTNLGPATPVKVTPSVPIPSKRKSRSLTDSEVLKSSNVNSLTPNLTPTQIKIPMKITPPSGKVRGRKKRSSVSISSESDDFLKEKTDSKRKRMSKGEKANFKDMESQCNEASTEVNGPNPSQKEVQLHISESGVISAKSIVSGEEKIIGQFDSEKTSQIQSPQVLPFSSPSEMPIKPQINGFANISNSKTVSVQLNIPTVNFNGILPNTSINSTGNSSPQQNPPPVSGKLSNRNKAGDISMLPKPSQLLTPKKLLEQMGIHGVSAKNLNPSSYESKKANMQKAIKDLQKKHSNVDIGTHNPLTGKNSKHLASCSGKSINGEKSGSVLSPVVNGPTPPPLPFPLSALASSGMTVNLIPSSVLKQTSPFVKGKDLQINSEQIESSPPSKKLKHHTTTLHNGEIRFTSPRQILPSTSKGNCSSGSEGSPTKPRKFFKSRHSAEDGASPVKINAKVQVDDKNKSPITNKTSNNNGMNSSKIPNNGISFNGGITQQLSPTTDLKLINSTSCKTSNTMTTPSRMSSTPTTTAIQSNPTQYSPSALSQFMQQYWDSLQFQIPQMAGIPQMNFLPVLNKDYNNSMSYLNPANCRPIIDPSMTSFQQNPSYSMIYTPNHFVSGLTNGIHPHNNGKGNGGDTATPTTFTTNTAQATDLSVSSKKNSPKEKKSKGNKEKDSRDVGNTLDLSVKKKIKAANGEGNIRTSPEVKGQSKNGSKSKSKSNLNFEAAVSISHTSIEKQSPHPVKSEINESNEVSAVAVPPVTSNGNGSLSPAPLHLSALPNLKNGGSSDSGMDSLSSTSETCDKEKELVDADFHTQNHSSPGQVVENKNLNPDAEAPDQEPSKPEPCVDKIFPEPILENGRYSPEVSNDSTDLVINEDCVGDSTSPLSSDTNNIEASNAESKINVENVNVNENQIEEKVEEIVLPQSNGHHEEDTTISENGNSATCSSQNGNDHPVKNIPVCNNNNELDPPASADLKISTRDKLESN